MEPSAAFVALANLPAAKKAAAVEGLIKVVNHNRNAHTKAKAWTPSDLATLGLPLSGFLCASLWRIPNFVARFAS